MKVEQIVCDVCGARQGAGKNGWWMLVVEHTFHLFKPTAITPIGGEMDICSAQCATKKLNEFMMPPLQLDKDFEEARKEIVPEPKEKHYDVAESKTKVDEVHWRHLPPSLQANVIMCTMCQGKGKIPKDEIVEHQFVVTGIHCPRCKGTGIEP